ncbi:tRNA pseudouridine(38-40) synthase TruA [Rickettsia endosymbiont of Cardiosporidium cionae]|uniref:tRNA pseudouridine(38-40) synthase TruA n=1 Tax=Rickettsia endosymbiont of Cardiosporidium cionae TaxID=2777155 RepID=UPI001894DDC3|nr:tRNA pseudouridine(38-40) synthase TruA [Rickettsia endosymbiont of Cardiosporidium cionae]KAF8818103.1 tRNA pseudouridine(38-40) synthase TruA [Rickettsia endosymbiont of Cardiosporidium cionae]
MYRYKVKIEYLGTAFSGWQKQSNSITIQSVIETAIFKYTKELVTVYAAGRTDASVHAYAQFAHFDLSKCYDVDSFKNAINHFLKPYPIVILDSCIVSSDFHARFSAKLRHYLYKIINRNSYNVIDTDLKYLIRSPLDTGAMQEAANYLLGKHDFSSFRSAHCQSKSAYKTITSIKVVRHHESIKIYISAPSFMYKMVRNIVGSLILVGKKKWNPIKMKEILEKCDRKFAGPTAPANALYLLNVDYDTEY